MSQLNESELRALLSHDFYIYGIRRKLSIFAHSIAGKYCILNLPIAKEQTIMLYMDRLIQERIVDALIHLELYLEGGLTAIRGMSGVPAIWLSN